MNVREVILALTPGDLLVVRRLNNVFVVDVFRIFFVVAVDREKFWFYSMQVNRKIDKWGRRIDAVGLDIASKLHVCCFESLFEERPYKAEYELIHADEF